MGNDASWTVVYGAFLVSSFNECGITEYAQCIVKRCVDQTVTEKVDVASCDGVSCTPFHCACTYVTKSPNQPLSCC